MKKFILAIIALVAIFSIEPCQAQSRRDSIMLSPIYEAKLDSVMDIMQRAKEGDAECQTIVGDWYFNGKHVDQDYEIAAKWWSNAAAQGNAYAIADLGICYHFGLGVECDTVKAMNLYKRSIEKGCTDLLDVLISVADDDSDILCSIVVAQCYQKGIGVGRSTEKAIEYYGKAAKKGSVDAQYELAMLLVNNNNPKDAAVWFRKASEGGNLVSTYYYGLLQYEGKGVTRDVQNGVIYMLRAAEDGLPAAQYKVGTIYATGKGLTQDAKQAVEWYMRAAGNDNAAAMWELAECYRLGKGVSVDFNRAAKWYSEALATGRYSRPFSKLCEEQVGTPFMTYLQALKAYYMDKDFDAAMKLFKEVEKAKFVNGKTMQGVMLLNDDYAGHDYKKAAKLLKQAAENGDYLAAYYLGIIYDKGLGVAQNQETALQFITQAADNGCAVAMCYLGDIFYEGRGCTQDYEMAVYYYELARRQLGLSQNAAKRLAYCYENGLGVYEVDKDEAEKVLKTKNTKISTILELI